MESFLADLINNPKVPKVIRYAIVLGLCLFILYIGIFTAVKSPMIGGRIFGVILSAAVLFAAIYLLRKIYKS